MKQSKDFPKNFHWIVRSSFQSVIKIFFKCFFFKAAVFPTSGNPSCWPASVDFLRACVVDNLQLQLLLFTKIGFREREKECLGWLYRPYKLPFDTEVYFPLVKIIIWITIRIWCGNRLLIWSTGTWYLTGRIFSRKHRPTAKKLRGHRQ